MGRKTYLALLIEFVEESLSKVLVFPSRLMSSGLVLAANGHLLHNVLKYGTKIICDGIDAMNSVVTYISIEFQLNML